MKLFAGFKKNELKPWQQKGWLIPVDHNCSFVADMGKVIDLYKLPFGPDHPVVCMDERLKMTEIELNAHIALIGNSRIDGTKKVRKQTCAWQGNRNNKAAKVYWQFTTNNARVKLLRLYPLFDD